MSSSFTAELAAAAARLIVEEGMEYGPAKRKAARKPRRVAGFGFDPGFGLRLAMAPMASLRRMLGGRKR